MQISPVDTMGATPGWISRHSVGYDAARKAMIRISGGQIVTARGSLRDNRTQQNERIGMGKQAFTCSAKGVLRSVMRAKFGQKLGRTYRACLDLLHIGWIDKGLTKAIP